MSTFYNTATPDSVYIYDENGNELIGCYYVQMDCKPVPFARGEYDEVIIGEVGQGHSDLQKDYCERIGRHFAINREGRFWMDKYVTAWGTNAHSEKMINNSRKFFKDLYEDLLTQQNLDIGDYIVLLEGPYDDAIVQGCNIMVARVRDFVKNGKLTEYIQFMTGGSNIDPSEPFKPTDGTPDMPRTRLDRERLWKYGWVAEDKKSKKKSVKEHVLYNPFESPHGTPDEIYLPDREFKSGVGFSWRDYEDNPVAFIIADGKLFIGGDMEVHDEIRKRIKNSGGSNFSGRGADGQIEGRIYNNEFISLWRYNNPEKIETQNACKEVIRMFNERSLKMRSAAFDGATDTIGDVGNMIIVFEPEYGEVYAATLKRYAATGKAYPYLDFFYPQKSEYEKNLERKEWEKDQWRHYQMVGEEIEEHDLQNPDGVAHGNPDQIYLPDRERKGGVGFTWSNSSDNQVSFIIDVPNDKLYVGNRDDIHSDIRQRIKTMGGSKFFGRGEEGQIEGRIYNNEFITLWTYNNPSSKKTQEASKKIIQKFNERAIAIKSNEKLAGWYKDTIGDVGRMTIVFEPEYGKVYAATMKNYAETGKAYPYLDFFYPQKSDYEKRIERKNWEKDQWRHYEMVGEQAMKLVKKMLKESRGGNEFVTPDVIKIFTNDDAHEPIYLSWTNEGAYPFIAAENGKLYVGDEGQSHYDVEQNADTPLEGEGIRGRIFDQNGYKVFMVWEYYLLPFNSKTIKAYQYLRELFKLTQKVDINDMITFFNVKGKIFASTVRNFIAGKKPVEYKQFFEEMENNATIPSAENGMNPKDIWRHYQFVGEQIAKHIIQEMKKRGGK